MLRIWLLGYNELEVSLGIFQPPTLEGCNQKLSYAGHVRSTAVQLQGSGCVPQGTYWAYIGIMEKKMETTNIGVTWG